MQFQKQDKKADNTASSKRVKPRDYREWDKWVCLWLFFIIMLLVCMTWLVAVWVSMLYKKF